MDSALPLLTAIGAAVACFVFLRARIFLGQRHSSTDAEALIPAVAPPGASAA
jgi:hypothetical protein